MANIKISLGVAVVDGQPLTFRAPCDCSNVTGIKVEYPNGEDTAFQVFSFTDAHGNDLTGLGNLFAEGAMVKVILDTDASKAFIQNADTNAYLEAKFDSKAPSGCGYGDPLTFYINEDNTFEAVLKQIYATMENGSAKQIQFYDNLGLYDNKFIGTLWRYTVEHGVLDAVSYSGLSARKRFHRSQWHPWEWVNPPMIAGVEYRTTERYNGDVVYCKHISHTSTESYGGYGDTPVSVSIPHGISGYDSIVRVDARHQGGHLLPIVTSGGGTAAVVGVTSSNIELRFNKCSFEARTWKFNLYYTKKEA